MGIFGGLARAQSLIDPNSEEMRRLREAAMIGQGVSSMQGPPIKAQGPLPQTEAEMRQALGLGPVTGVLGGPPMLGPGLQAMIGKAPKKLEGWRAPVGMALAAIGDHFSGTSTAVPMVSKLIAANKERYDKGLDAYNERKRIASLPGMTEREMAAYMANPDQWGSQMSNAFASRHQAANVGQTETRVYGNPNEGGSVYQPVRTFEDGPNVVQVDPMSGQNRTLYAGQTDGEHYARTLGLKPGSNEWHTAVRDQQLGANGPTAIMGRQTLEGQRQNNRMQLRGTPQARLPAPQRQPGPARVPTASSVMGGIMQKIANGQPLTPGEQQIYNSRPGQGGYRGGRIGSGGSGGMSPPAAPSAGGVQVGQTATDPRTGRKVRFDGQRWVPVQ